MTVESGAIESEGPALDGLSRNFPPFITAMIVLLYLFRVV
jgi:hypothetical protein